MDTTTVVTNQISRQIVFLLIATFFLFASIAKANTAATASLYRIDTVTEGTWQGVYGADGSAIANVTPSVPSYATFAAQNQSTWTWAPSTSDPRALQIATGRAATTWYNSSSFSFDVNFTDGATHSFELYAVDWDSRGRSETVQVLDANSGAPLYSQTISNFVNGTYLVFNIAGHVKLNVTSNSGPNAVISGVFFGGSSASAIATTAPKAATASLFRADITTQGNWQSAYGSDGYSFVGGSQSMPSYAAFSVQNQSNWTWAPSTSDPRALQTNSGRIAATWYSGSNFSFDVNFTDGNAHTFSMYALDWDNQNRAEAIQIVDANSGVTLSNQNISSFTNGMYLVYTISGHVKINVYVTCGPNAVISGVFFGTVTPYTSQQVTTPVTTAPPAPAPALTYVLSTSSASLNLGTVTVSQNASQVVTLTNSGTGNVTISNVTVVGAGFNVSGVSTGTVLTPGQSASFTATFAPASAGAFSGSVAVVSNVAAGVTTITLSGTGAAQQHSVALAWSASSSSNIVGYNTYYSIVSGGPYAKLNSTPVASIGYTDSTVTAGMTRYYVVTAVNSSSEESGYSAEVGVTIP